MNKQEIIKKLESIKAIGNDAIAACYNESMNAGITLMKKIDEPQKPKTEVFNHDEKFVVEWLDHTTGYHYSLYNAINDAGSEVRSWMKIDSILTNLLERSCRWTTRLRKSRCMKLLLVTYILSRNLITEMISILILAARCVLGKNLLTS